MSKRFILIMLGLMILSGIAAFKFAGWLKLGTGGQIFVVALYAGIIVVWTCFLFYRLAMNYIDHKNGR